MLIMLELIAESDMYAAGKKQQAKKKDVRNSPSHVNNKPHGLIIASHHPKVGHVQVGSNEEESQAQGKD